MHIGKKGFTLVEIIVSLAIMTIVAGAVGAFMVAGNNSYMRGNKELTLQEEAQLTANQIIDMIIDVEKDIQFTDNGTTSELFLENEKNSYLLQWREGSGASDPGRVYFHESDNTLDADGNLVWSTESLLAEYVTKFDVDLSGVRSDRTVILRMDFAYQDKSYSINETIRLRNDLSAAKGTDYVWISGLQISPKNPTVKTAESLNFSYRILGDPEAAETEMAKPDPVTWKVEYYNDGGTPTPCKSSIDAKTGRLTIDTNEVAGNNILRVTCTLNSNPAFQDTALVNIQDRKVLGLTITPKNIDIERGTSDTFTYTLTGTQAGMDAGVTWKVERVNGAALASGTKITSTGDGTPTSDENGNLVKNGTAQLAVGTAERTGTYVLRVTCTSNADSAYYDTALVTVTAIKGQYTVELIPGVLTEYEFTESGETRMGYKVDIECLPSWADYANGYPLITWEVVDDASGYTLEPFEADPSNIYKQTLKCSTNINTTVTIRAKVQLDAENWYYPSLDIPIPNLQKAKDSKAPYIYSNQFVLYRNGTVTCELKNYDGNMDEVVWSIANDAELGLLDTVNGGKMTKEEEATKIYQAIHKYDWPVNYPDAESIGTVRNYRTVGFSKAAPEYTYNSDGKAVNIANRREIFAEDYDNTKVPQSVSGAPEKEAGCNNVYPTATGKYVYVWAKGYLDWTKEYRLKLQASDKEGNLIAETDLLIPAVSIFFPEDQRYITINQSDWLYIDGRQSDGGVYDYPLEATIYGFNAGNIGLTDTTPRMVLEPQLYNDKKEIVSGTRVSAQLDDSKEHLKLYIAADVEDPVMYLKFYDSRNIGIDRVVTIYWNRVKK